MTYTYTHTQREGEGERTYTRTDAHTHICAGHLTILRGNLAPEGSVAKITGKEGLRFEGTALAYDSEEVWVVWRERCRFCLSFLLACMA